eukprot:scaffold2566_cov33-Tisochrysis_lutea.AAC.4
MKPKPKACPLCAQCSSLPAMTRNEGKPPTLRCERIENRASCVPIPKPHNGLTSVSAHAAYMHPSSHRPKGGRSFGLHLGYFVGIRNGKEPS